MGAVSPATAQSRAALAEFLEQQHVGSIRKFDGSREAATPPRQRQRQRRQVSHASSDYDFDDHTGGAESSWTAGDDVGNGQDNISGGDKDGVWDSGGNIRGGKLSGETGGNGGGLRRNLAAEVSPRRGWRANTRGGCGRGRGSRPRPSEENEGKLGALGGCGGQVSGFDEGIVAAGSGEMGLKDAEVGNTVKELTRQGQRDWILRQHTLCKARRARFVLDHWAAFSPLLDPQVRSRDGPVARRLIQAEQAGLCAESLVKCWPMAPVRGQPKAVVGGEMRDYQIQGLRWLVQQHDRCAPSILGDEMGLGKTVQMLAFFAFLKTIRGEGGPHLVLAPLSVLGAWANECRRWCPSLKMICFHGPMAERERLRHEVLNREAIDVVCSTYDMLVADPSGLGSRYVWNYVVFDEAHRVKNEMSLVGQAVRRLRSNHRILVTGTPLQNNLHELWSLLNLLYPEVLASSAAFDNSFRLYQVSTLSPASANGNATTAHESAAPNDKDQGSVCAAGGAAADSHSGNGNGGLVNASLIAAAHALLRPLMLRRLKSEVLGGELPPKVEQTIELPLSGLQRLLYAALLRRDLGQIVESAHANAGASARILEYRRLNGIVMQLRKVCDHPYLLPGVDPLQTDERLVAASSKLRFLDRLLARLRSCGRRVLIYSQFTSMLDILADYLRFRGYKFLRLDGSTPAARRRYEIACFESPKSPFLAYLISTRAGGLGITLVAADTVVLFDSDWNPAADAQAMDRAHRIGQRHPVRCYRLAAAGTVEGRIIAASRNKRVVNAFVIRDSPATLAADTIAGNGTAAIHDNSRGGGNGNGGAESGAAAGLSLSDLMSTLVEGARCVSGGELDASREGVAAAAGAADPDDAAIDALVEQAEAAADKALAALATATVAAATLDSNCAVAITLNSTNAACSALASTTSSAARQIAASEASVSPLDSAAWTKAALSANSITSTAMTIQGSEDREAQVALDTLKEISRANDKPLADSYHANCSTSATIADGAVVEQDEESMKEAGKRVAAAGTGAEDDEKATEAALARLLRTLPPIRAFEGRDYADCRRADGSSGGINGAGGGGRRRAGDDAALRALAEQWEQAAANAGSGGGWEEGKGEVGDERVADRKMSHRRVCQGCRRSFGAMLFCSRCPVILHRFCLRTAVVSVATSADSKAASPPSLFLASDPNDRGQKEETDQDEEDERKGSESAEEVEIKCKSNVHGVDGDKVAEESGGDVSATSQGVEVSTADQQAEEAALDGHPVGMEDPAEEALCERLIAWLLRRRDAVRLAVLLDPAPPPLSTAKSGAAAPPPPGRADAANNSETAPAVFSAKLQPPAGVTAVAGKAIKAKIGGQALQALARVHLQLREGLYRSPYNLATDVRKVLEQAGAQAAAAAANFNTSIAKEAKFSRVPPPSATWGASGAIVDRQENQLSPPPLAAVPLPTTSVSTLNREMNINITSTIPTDTELRLHRRAVLAAVAAARRLRRTFDTTWDELGLPTAASPPSAIVAENIKVFKGTPEILGSPGQDGANTCAGGDEEEEWPGRLVSLLRMLLASQTDVASASPKNSANKGRLFSSGKGRKVKSPVRGAATLLKDEGQGADHEVEGNQVALLDARAVLTAALARLERALAALPTAGSNSSILVPGATRKALLVNDDISQKTSAVPDWVEVRSRDDAAAAAVAEVQRRLKEVLQARGLLVPAARKAARLTLDRFVAACRRIRSPSTRAAKKTAAAAADQAAAAGTAAAAAAKKAEGKEEQPAVAKAKDLTGPRRVEGPGSARWLCPHHRCAATGRSPTDSGGLLFRCVDCPLAFSDAALADGFQPVDADAALAALHYQPPSSAEYIRCAACSAARPEAPAILPFEPAAENLSAAAASAALDSTATNTELDLHSAKGVHKGGGSEAKSARSENQSQAADGGSGVGKHATIPRGVSADVEAADQAAARRAEAAAERAARAAQRAANRPGPPTPPPPSPNTPASASRRGRPPRSPTGISPFRESPGRRSTADREGDAGDGGEIPTTKRRTGLTASPIQKRADELGAPPGPIAAMGAETARPTVERVGGTRADLHEGGDGEVEFARATPKRRRLSPTFVREAVAAGEIVSDDGARAKGRTESRRVLRSQGEAAGGLDQAAAELLMKARIRRTRV